MNSTKAGGTTACQWNAERQEKVRAFSRVICAALLLIAGVGWWRSKPAAPWLFLLSLAFLLLGLLAPKVLDPVERAWMWLGKKMGLVMTPVAFSMIFFGAITPLGLVMRILGKDELKLRFDPDASSYWVPVEKDGPATRPDKPY